MRQNLRLATVLIILVNLYGCSPTPTGVPAQTEREMLAEAYTGKWAAQLNLEPIPVSFLPNLQAGFHEPYVVCGLVPHGQRRIAYDSPCINGYEDPIIQWISAHETAHIYYRDYENGESCRVENRADQLANTLTGIKANSHPECQTSGYAARIVGVH